MSPAFKTITLVNIIQNKYHGNPFVINSSTSKTLCFLWNLIEHKLRELLGIPLNVSYTAIVHDSGALEHPSSPVSQRVFNTM